MQSLQESHGAALTDIHVSRMTGTYPPVDYALNQGWPGVSRGALGVLRGIEGWIFNVYSTQSLHNSCWAVRKLYRELTDMR